MIERKEIDITAPITNEQYSILHTAVLSTIEFNHDCPELSEEELAQFRRVSNIRNSER